MLSQELGTHLTGRYVAIELYPYSFSEYLVARQAAAISIHQLKTLIKGS